MGKEKKKRLEDFSRTDELLFSFVLLREKKKTKNKCMRKKEEETELTFSGLLVLLFLSRSSFSCKNFEDHSPSSKRSAGQPGRTYRCLNERPASLLPLLLLLWTSRVGPGAFVRQALEKTTSTRRGRRGRRRTEEDKKEEEEREVLLDS